MKKEKAYETLRVRIVTKRVTPGEILNEKEERNTSESTTAEETVLSSGIKDDCSDLVNSVR